MYKLISDFVEVNFFYMNVRIIRTYCISTLNPDILSKFFHMLILGPFNPDIPNHKIDFHDYKSQGD